MANCKGICESFKVQKSKGMRGSPYLAGNKRCKVCNVYVPKTFESLFCPCCGMKFALKPILLKRNRDKFIQSTKPKPKTKPISL